MRAIGTGAPRLTRNAALLISTLILLALPALSGGEAGPAAGKEADGAAGPAAEAAKPGSTAGDRTAAAKDAISRAITSYEKDIRDAYYRALIENPDVEGEVVVSFTVRPGGDVTDVRIEKSSLNWPPLEEEVLGRIAAWKFPPFEGEPIPATVPYKFQSN